MVKIMVVTYVIKQVDKDNAGPVVEFMKALRKEVFPMLDKQPLPADIVQFHDYYMNRNDAAVFAAISEEGKVLGTIGYLPYDNRFADLWHLYTETKTTELVRCYIDSQYRRQGVGTALYQTALASIHAAGYDKIYLHSHPFLPGGIPFWKSLGFEERLAESDPVWNTLHMDKKIGEIK
ncbi:GNAT family N-acetyltransferase [Gracilibacillus sp. S3-1-1]|uniref:GNAT family N-acetyltransferase n=1 Tax=Gracilibacillus pellucidus TaxID=3095368 RepID=A0ACC6M4S5_9BACI|nr:GNAT family N-acetyltransferase [Gracilibacillus sp. S3-1-1]MDX8045827.1 GNAT family N-acetyltransferase [Gracilibacillus sp. S3-1-1]